MEEGIGVADPSIPFIDAIQDEAEKQIKIVTTQAAKYENPVNAKVVVDVESVKAEVTASAEGAAGAVQVGVQETEGNVKLEHETTTEEAIEVATTLTEKVSDGESLMTGLFNEVKTGIISCEEPVCDEDIKVEVKKVDDDAAASVNRSRVVTAESMAEDDKAEFTGFRMIERENKDVPATDEDVAKLCESVGFIYSPYYTGIGFRVGDKYIMTSHHIIKSITEKIPSLGAVPPEQKLIKSSEIWIQFDYLQMGEYELDNQTRFSFARITYTNKALDVAIIELEIPDDKTLPRPLASFWLLENGSKVEFLGHNGAPSKRRTLVPQICIPTEEELQKVSSWCKGQGYEEASYRSLMESGRVCFQQAFAYSQCGSPGVALRGEELAVGVMLTKNYPPFFHELVEEEQRQIPNSLQLDEGVSMSAIYEALKDQEQTSELCNNIFGQALRREMS